MGPQFCGKGRYLQGDITGEILLRIKLKRDGDGGLAIARSCLAQFHGFCLKFDWFL
tara:strand:- start:938 stop:1105 length:168 start_codon:yes stop_codon:yes gene_type:complete